jgi:hypothetical protein
MTLLPFQQGDVVAFAGESGFVREVRGDRLVIELADGTLHLMTQEQLRVHQPARKGAA